MQRISGFVERGNTTVTVGGIGSSNTVQGSFPSCTVSVFATGTTNLVTLYSDNGVTLKANPFVAASDGSFFFYCANQRVDVQFSGTGIATPFSIGDILIQDNAQFSSSGTTVVFSATPTFNCALFSFFEITLTGNVTGPVFSNPVLWQVIHLSIAQDGTGGRTWAWPGTFLHPPTIASAANAVTEATFFWDGTNWRNVSATGDSLAVPSNATIAGSLTVSGNGAAGNAALKLASTDGVIYVSTSGSDANDGLSPGTAKATIQAAINALPSRGGIVQLLGGVFSQNTSLTLKANLTIQGVGRGDVSGSPATVITTTLGSGDLFPITNLAEVCLRDFSVSNTGSAGANACIRLNYGQRCVCQRLFISGPFAVGIELDTSSTSAASTIRNWFDNILITGLATNGIGVLLNSSDATTKVINNNVFWMVAAQGGNGGVGLKVTNSNLAQIINENFFYGDEFATNTGVSGGTGILFTSTATRGMVFIGCNVESNHVGLNKATGNTVTFIGGNFSSNDTNVTDAQSAFTSFINTNVGGTVQQFAVTPAGAIQADSYSLGASGSAGTNTINGPSGWQLDASGGANVILNSTSTEFARNIITDSGIKITQYDGIATAGQGVPPIRGATSQKSENAADTNVLTYTPPAVAGLYRISFAMDVSAANTATLGWTASWKDANGNAENPTNLSLWQTGTAAPALTFTTSSITGYYGFAIISIDASATNIVVKLTFSGTSFTAKVSASIERLI